MLVIQPGCWNSRDEKLRTVGTRASACKPTTRTRDTCEVHNATYATFMEPQKACSAETHPAFAIETVNGRSWRRSRWNSSSKLPPAQRINVSREHLTATHERPANERRRVSGRYAPQILSPPVPSPKGSPVCTMKPLITRWNMTLS